MNHCYDHIQQNLPGELPIGDDCRCQNGLAPPGMNIVNGNLEGEPSEAGEFKVQLSITAVQGYQYQSFAPSVAPRSREITVFVR